MSSKIPDTAPEVSNSRRVLFGLWLLACCAGFGAMILYSAIPGQMQATNAAWPDESTLSRNPKGGTLVMFVHPQCPCSRASLSELEELLAHSDGQLDASVVFLEPEKAPWDAKGGSLKEMAGRISGVRVVDDRNGGEARRFGAETSGETFLYDAKGWLVFHGGITSTRGHVGINAGRVAIQEWATEGTCPLTSAPVFGCPLSDDSREAGL
jgi:hypothetical protein